MKKDDYLQYDFTDIKTPIPINRRDFIKRLGGGIIIVMSISEFFKANAEILQGSQMSEDMNVYLRIKEDGKVDCFTGKIEMGQGVITSLAQMLAEELDVKLTHVDMVMGDTDLCPWDMGTFGSMSTRFFGPPLRAAGAEARATLLQLASKQMKIPVSGLRVSDGIVFEKSNKTNSLSYAELTKGKKIIKSVSEKPVLKKPSEFKVIGQPVLKQDSELKVTGKAQYAGDIRLPGMVYASILRPPVHGSKISSIDSSKAEEIQGVEIIKDNELIAALHPDPHIASKAIDEIQIKYEIPEGDIDDTSIFDYLVTNAPKANVVDKGGTIDIKTFSDTLFEKEYYNSYVAHATMELIQLLPLLKEKK